MGDAWGRMASCNAAPLFKDSPYMSWSFGHAAFACHQSQMYKHLYGQCLIAYQQLHFEPVQDGKILADLVKHQ